MIDTQAIRKKILDLALRGKLTEQLPEDGTAEELYRLIQSEKPFASDPNLMIRDEEKPFIIPFSWMFVRLNSIAILHNGRAYSQTELLSEGKYPVLRVGNLFTNNSWYYSDMELESVKYCDKGDLLYAWSASFGPYIWNGGKVIYHYHIWKIEHSQFIDRDYLYYYLMADTHRIKKAAHGMAMIHVTKANTEKSVIALPPLPEQHRIVAKIDAIFSLLDTIDTLQSQYQDNLATLKSKIIDAGIQGKLTEQLPEDGTAEELYQQIQQEKLALEKAGKIKKAKPLPPISDEEKPFDIPDNWRWVSVGDVCTNIQYGTSKKSSETGKVPVIRMGNLQGGRIVYDKLAYTSDDSEIEKYPLEVNDLLFNRTNSMELVGKTAIYKGEMPAIYAGYLVRVTPVLMVSDYLNYVMQTKYYWDYCRMVRIDANGQSNINAEKLKRFVFPLPPLAEQKRIVAKLEELLPLCEG